MSANAVAHRAGFDVFRKAWVSGHLDYQRAAEALETAIQHRALSGESAEADAARRADEEIDRARRHLAEVESIVGEHFDRFCGLSEVRLPRERSERRPRSLTAIPTPEKWTGKLLSSAAGLLGISGRRSGR